MALWFFVWFFFFFQAEDGIRDRLSLVGSEMCIRDRWSWWVGLTHGSSDVAFGWLSFIRRVDRPGRTYLVSRAGRHVECRTATRRRRQKSRESDPPTRTIIAPADEPPHPSRSQTNRPHPPIVTSPQLPAYLSLIH